MTPVTESIDRRPSNAAAFAVGLADAGNVLMKHEGKLRLLSFGFDKYDGPSLILTADHPDEIADALDVLDALTFNRMETSPFGERWWYAAALDGIKVSIVFPADVREQVAA